MLGKAQHREDDTVKIEVFEMERMQSTWENVVEYDLSESGVLPVSLRELSDMGFDLEWALDTPLSYSQSNGTPELREALARLYPGTTSENFEVTNGTSEANFLVPLSLLQEGDRFALEVPNYMQMWGVPRSMGAEVKTFQLRQEDGWEPDWAEFEAAVTPRTRLVYVSNPNNPTGSVLSVGAMERMVKRCEEMDAYLLADEVYLGAEIDRPRTPSFWGMSDRVIVTSGLSKAYGIPGVRIGWIVGPKELIHECWTQHDSVTICPNKLSDAVARVAVQKDNREKLFERGRALLQRNRRIFSEWVAGLGDRFSFINPEAGAMAFMKYSSPTPSLELVERIRKNQSTLIVPGIHLGLEGYLRIWLGGEQDYLEEGLRRVAVELAKP
jgi:aspartate/methionine/tyrosine aminotransferase